MLTQNQLQMFQKLIAAQQNQSDGLVSFKAGRMDFDPYSRVVTAIKTPGRVRVVRDDTGVMHLHWVNRLSREKVVDIMLFPNAAVWERVADCKDGRVYVLRMVGSEKRDFFWMQEPSEEKDEEIADKLRKVCRGERLESEGPAPAAGQDPMQQAMMQSLSGGPAQGGQPSGRRNTAGMDLSQMLLQAMQNTMPQGQGQTHPQGMASVPEGRAAQQGGAPQQGNALANLLAGAMQAQGLRNKELIEQLKREPDLTDILDPEHNAEIECTLEDEKVCEELAKFLPQGMNSAEAIIEQMQSPQFRSAVGRLQAILNGPNLTVILQQMGLPATEAMGVKAFIDAIIKKYGSEEDQSGDTT